VPVDRNNTPENPHKNACFLEMDPILIKRSFQILLFVNKASISFILYGNCKEKSKSFSKNNRFQFFKIPPGLKKLACILAPETIS